MRGKSGSSQVLRAPQEEGQDSSRPFCRETASSPLAPGTHSSCADVAPSTLTTEARHAAPSTQSYVREGARDGTSPGARLASLHPQGLPSEPSESCPGKTAATAVLTCSQGVGVQPQQPRRAPRSMETEQQGLAGGGQSWKTMKWGRSGMTGL